MDNTSEKRTDAKNKILSDEQVLTGTNVTEVKTLSNTEQVKKVEEQIIKDINRHKIPILLHWTFEYYNGQTTKSLYLPMISRGLHCELPNVCIALTNLVETRQVMLTGSLNKQEISAEFIAKMVDVWDNAKKGFDESGKRISKYALPNKIKGGIVKPFFTGQTDEDIATMIA